MKERAVPQGKRTVSEGAESMKKSFVVNTFNCIVALVTAAALLAMAFGGMAASKWLAGSLFMILGIVFLVVAALNGSVIRISPEVVERVILGKTVSSLKIKNIQEVGVVGTKVFGDPKKPGTRYIYFSPRKMDDKERFAMCLSWPPKKELFMTWSRERYLAVQSIWSSEIVEYGAGDLE